MGRFEKNKVLAKLMADYYNEKENTTKHHSEEFAWRECDLVKINGTKESLLDILKWFYKYHRKEYHYWSFWTQKKASHSFNNAIHEDWGDGGYLPFFSDKPDYYYICG